MDKKNKIFFLVFALLIIGSVAFTYWRIMIKKDYIVESQIDCDPYAETCFIWECDPASVVEGEACTGDPEADVWYYKIAERNAGNVPLCDPNIDESCEPWTCEPEEKDCGEILCNEENKIEQEAECSDPEEYALNNPVEEKAVECENPPAGEAGGDEECLSAQEEVSCEEGDEECVESSVADLPADEAEESGKEVESSVEETNLPAGEEAVAPVE